MHCLYTFVQEIVCCPLHKDCKSGGQMACDRDTKDNMRRDISLLADAFLSLIYLFPVHDPLSKATSFIVSVQPGGSLHEN